MKPSDYETAARACFFISALAVWVYGGFALATAYLFLGVALSLGSHATQLRTQEERIQIHRRMELLMTKEGELDRMVQGSGVPSYSPEYWAQKHGN